MSYGMIILTTDGFLPISDLRGGRLVQRMTLTGLDGSAVANNFDSSRGEVIMFSNDQKIVPNYTFNNSTKVFSWTNQAGNDGNYIGSCSQNFTVNFVHVR